MGYCADDDGAAGAAAVVVVVVDVVAVGLSFRLLFGKTVDSGAGDVRYGSDSGKSYRLDPGHVRCYCTVTIVKMIQHADPPAVVALEDGYRELDIDVAGG